MQTGLIERWTVQIFDVYTVWTTRATKFLLHDPCDHHICSLVSQLVHQRSTIRHIKHTGCLRRNLCRDAQHFWLHLFVNYFPSSTLDCPPERSLNHPWWWNIDLQLHDPQISCGLLKEGYHPVEVCCELITSSVRTALQGPFRSLAPPTIPQRVLDCQPTPHHHLHIDFSLSAAVMSISIVAH